MTKKKSKQKLKPTSVYLSAETKKYFSDKAELEGRCLSVTIIRVLEGFKDAHP